MSEHGDDELLSELRRVLAKADPTPEAVGEFAKAALGWRDIDAELAELLSDSALETEGAALFRSGESPRRLTFRAETLSIEVEVQPAGAGRMLLGQIAPPTTATVEVELESGEIGSTADADELGRFRLALVTGGRIRLRLGSIQTSWVTI